MKLTLLLQPSETSTENVSKHVSLEIDIPAEETVATLIASLPAAQIAQSGTGAGSGSGSANIALFFAGQRLLPENKLDSYGITPQDEPPVIYITLGENCDVPPVKPKRKSKSSKSSKSKRCTFAQCHSLPLRMVGDCQLCQGKFCSKHRLLESHQCKGLKSWKDTCFERNAMKLQSEQTVAPKV